MKKWAYYNDNDPYVCEWVRNLIAAGHIAPGIVDCRSITEVKPDDLREFVQVHMFCGIAGWSLALRLAGWPDDRPVWTGSCPCQPFSAAGQGKAADDERHLWPAWFPLIAERRPPIVFGEQVEAAVGWGWLDAVFADLEGQGYACGAAILPACGVGAPHIRQRCWFVGHADVHHSAQHALLRPQSENSVEVGGASFNGHLADTYGRDASAERIQRGGEYGQQPQDGGRAGAVANSKRGRPSSRNERSAASPASLPASHSWACDWLPCTDGKARPVEPLAQQMADGLPEGLGRVRPEVVAEIEKEILNAAHSESNAREAVHDLWLSLWPQALRERSPGRPHGVHEPRFLLAFMRQLTGQGWAFSKSVSRASAKTEEAGLRSVWRNEAATCPSCGRGLDEQRPEQCPNTLHVLPSILARHAQAAWGEAFDANARATFPLAHGIPGRVGRLRAYGNAITPQCAQAFIEAYMSVAP